MRRIVIISLALLASTAPAAFAQVAAPAETSVTTTTATTTMQRRGPDQWPAGANTVSTATSTSAAPQSTIDSYGSGAIPALAISQQSANGVNYLTGGIGDEEVAELKAHASEYNVQLLLTGTNGEYLSEAVVRIGKTDGAEVATIQNAGPYIYVSLPAGKYKFEVTAKQGGIKDIAITAPASGAAKSQLRFAE